MTDHSLDPYLIHVDPEAVKAIAIRVERLTRDLAVTGIAPLGRSAAIWLVENAIAGTGGAGAMFWMVLNLVDVLAAQTAAIADSGAQRANGAEALGLRRQAATMRTCRRAIPELRRLITRSAGHASFFLRTSTRVQPSQQRRSTNADCETLQPKQGS